MMRNPRGFYGQYLPRSLNVSYVGPPSNLARIV